MRRLLVLATIAALATGAAEAAFAQVPVLLRTPGAQAFELENGFGRAVVTGKGAVLITVGRGRIRVVDLPGIGRPNLSRRCRARAHRVSRTTLELRGRGLGCVVWTGKNGGRWQVITRGRRIDASGNVRGSLTLDAVDEGRTGRYRIGAGGWQRWPREVQTYGLNRK
ncbi:MAG: hypothetical protein ACRDNG_01125 [Gaiellaceae bacterium]